MANRRLKVGLIGTGHIGRLHAEDLARRIPNADLLAVADVYVDAAKRCAERLGVPRVFTDYHAILDASDIDAVVVCSPSDTHGRIIGEAAAVGKHVFCEKPIDYHLAKIDLALEAVERAGVKLQIGFHRRFDANFRRVKRAIEQNEIGQPMLLHIVSRDPTPPPIDYVKTYLQHGGSLFLDMMIHDFDLARYLVGSEVEEIYALGGLPVSQQTAELGDLDTAIVTLRFTNGVIATIDNCRRAVYGYDQRLEMFGSGGSISVGNNFPNNAILSNGERISRDLPLHFFTERYVEAYTAEIQAFVDSILDDQPIQVTGQDGRAPVVMALAAQKSVRERRPVSLSEIEA
ncbi:MAG TPA: inositol 2-dehydrogenase [Chloroflexota bacterium]|nr:inositol 2-dehydrogenase [Chloroflexota bacterium]